MPMTGEEIETIIKTAIPDAIIELVDTAGDNNHWSATVTSSEFAGKSRVQQHQMINKAFGEKLGTTLHALALSTRVPE
ncbi:MAG: BolA/IbaG family iron-sulfur metabolism protein [Hyphomicrobiaceae bacterium]|nr:BolA/IbaG family iron-sulfur metabolism protein [Hyphomicrobiaceae bacterium]